MFAAYTDMPSRVRVALNPGETGQQYSTVQAGLSLPDGPLHEAAEWGQQPPPTPNLTQRKSLN